MPGSAETRYLTPSRSSPRAITGIRCRLGLDAKIALGDRFSLSLDAAWLPYVKFNGADSHWLRIGTSSRRFHRRRSGRWARQRLSARGGHCLCGQSQCQLRRRRPLLAHGIERPHPFRRPRGRGATRCRSRSTGRSRISASSCRVRSNSAPIRPAAFSDLVRLTRPDFLAPCNASSAPR